MRTTNLIQSYVANPPAMQQYNSDKVVKNFDVQKELSNRTFIKPLPSNGHLVKTGFFDIPSEIKKDIKYDIKAFGHAVKGEANDHELGRLNDVGMKIGGLAIASYLFTKKQTPMTKIFEFVGLGTFFGAMDLWPKLFIQLPAKLIHGVNVRQEYEDNYGRKKMFYQDHQFIPWDLYSEKEINKIGDRLHVPKDIPNRREFIQEKMRKIALQNNTLWMLTAGFATPLMSALMCNALEKPISKYMDQRMNKRAESLMTNFPQEIQKYDFSKSEAELAKILSENKGKPITPELYDAIASNITDGLDNVVSTNVRKDLAQLLPTDDKFKLSEETLNGVQKSMSDILAPAKLSKEEIAKLIPDGDAISHALSSRNLLEGQYKDFSEHSKVIQNLFEKNVNKFIEENPNNPATKKLNFLMQKFIHSSAHGESSPLVKALKLQPAAVLSENLAESLKGISSTLNKMKAGSSVLDKYAYMKVAQAPETGLANAWNETENAIFKAMNFSPEEIRMARLDGEISSEIMRNKLESITSDKVAYGKFIESVEKAFSTLHGKMSSLDMTQAKTSNLYKSNVETTFNNAANVLKGAGFSNTAEALVGFQDTAQTSLKDVMLNFVTDRVKGVKTSFYRLLNLADMYHKISMVEGLDSVLTPQMPRAIKEELVELAKQTLMDGHNSDFAVKFWQKRDPNPDKTDFSQIRTSAGKVINKYFGTKESTELVEIANDRNYFDAVMKLMFGGDLHHDTVEKIQSSVFFDDFKRYRAQALDILGGDFYFAKPNFLVNGRRVDTSSETKFLMMGSAPSDMAFKHFNNTFNGNKWFKIFGTLGAGLVGVTLLSQFFIGYMKKPQQAKEAK